MEVSVPYVDMILDNPPARSPGLKDRIELGLLPRLYYSQITWVEPALKPIQKGRFGTELMSLTVVMGISCGPGQKPSDCSPVDELSPISPDIDDKRVRWFNVAYQTLSCYEGQVEVYYARISSGALWDAWGNKVDVWATPMGNFPIWRKLVSLHMSGGQLEGGGIRRGIGWTSLFVGSGVAIHSTFWHNNFGEPMSRGCADASPDDAKWVFRWANPSVPYDPGDVTIPWPGGTKVEVVEDRWVLLHISQIAYIPSRAIGAVDLITVGLH